MIATFACTLEWENMCTGDEICRYGYEIQSFERMIKAMGGQILDMSFVCKEGGDAAPDTASAIFRIDMPTPRFEFLLANLEMFAHEPHLINLTNSSVLPKFVHLPKEYIPDFNDDELPFK